jgi:hypothetical protein
MFKIKNTPGNYLGAILLLVLIFSSCKKQTLQTFDEANDGVYFNNYDIVAKFQDPDDGLISSNEDSVLILPLLSFISQSSDTVLYPFPMSITGVASDHDREVKISVVAAGTTAKAGVDYETLPEHFIFHAGKYNDTGWVKLYNAHPGIDSTKSLLIGLEPSPELMLNLPVISDGYHALLTTLKRGVSFGDTLVAPYLWANSGCRLGLFSKKKYDLINQQFGYLIPQPADTWWATPADVFGHATTIINEILALLQQYLIQQALLGTPVLYEDGTPMAIGDDDNC